MGIMKKHLLFALQIQKFTKKRSQFGENPDVYILTLRCRYPLRYDSEDESEGFLNTLDDIKRVSIVMKSQKNFWWKKFSSKFLTQIWHFLEVFGEVSLNRGVFYVPITHETMTMEASDSP